jgi:hypothetical protein
MPASTLMRLFVAGFLAILFLQSGIDKVLDRQGNLDWLRGHFAKSPLARMVSLMLSVLTGLELGAGALSLIGCAFIPSGQTIIAYYGAIVSALTILALFFGQRVAKDYAGAAVLVSYFLVTLVAIYLLAP